MTNIGQIFSENSLALALGIEQTIDSLEMNAPHFFCDIKICLLITVQRRLRAV